jgi:uncharacterized protein (TIGR02453 family)
VSLIEQLAHDFETLAPELVANPKCIFRIYRDTRFSDDKSPLKTNIAASFPWRGLPRYQGAGLYIEVAPRWVWVGGGMYAPDTSQLAIEREHIAANYKRLRAIVESPGFRTAVGRWTARSCSGCRAVTRPITRRPTTFASNSSWPARSSPPSSPAAHASMPGFSACTAR